VRAVVRAGGEPVLLINDEENVDGLLATLDGVVLTGGVDVDPVRYGGNPKHSHSQAARYRADRDGFEIALVRRTRELDVPTLCICRGIQIANVAFGGTLIEDVRDELGSHYTINHRQTYENGQDRSDYAPGHEVALDPGSAFARLIELRSFPANSMHHQAVRTVAQEFRVVGRTADGIVEAFETAGDHPFFFAVQWHPEELTPDAVSERLFAGLTRHARVRRNGAALKAD
jgi:putative glutamine amidotransferase